MAVQLIAKSKSVQDQVSAAEWAARVDLAAGHRVLAHYGVNDLTYNHFGLRVPDPAPYVWLQLGACILALLERREAAFEWLERSVSSGFACWPFFLKDFCLQNLLSLPEFEVLVSALQAKYPDHLGLL